MNKNIFASITVILILVLTIFGTISVGSIRTKNSLNNNLNSDIIRSPAEFEPAKELIIVYRWYLF